MLRAGVVGHVDDYVALMKPRVILLLLFTAFGAMVVAAGGIPGL